MPHAQRGASSVGLTAAQCRARSSGTRPRSPRYWVDLPEVSGLHARRGKGHRGETEP